MHWALLLVLLLPACGGPRFDGSTLHKRHVDYRVGPLDPGFRRVEVEGNDLAFHKPGAGTIAVHASCRDYDDVPQPVLLKHLLFGLSHRTYLVQEEVVIDGRGAQHAVVDAELDGVPVRLELYLLTRANCVFDLSYISDRTARAQADFTRFVQGFHILAVRP